jgi:hypothetical protein
MESAARGWFLVPGDSDGKGTSPGRWRHANDVQGRLALCKYILRPPLANDRLKILDDSVVRLEFKKPWSDALLLSHYISWSLLLKKTFEIDTICPRCKTPLRLIAMIETENTIKKILSAMGLPTCAPKLWPARPPPSKSGGECRDWLN